MIVRIDGGKEMKLENFYARVKVGIADKELKHRLQSLLDDVVSRLPDEKQFQIRGIIGFAKFDLMVKYWDCIQPNGVVVQELRKTGPIGFCNAYTTKTGDIYSFFICYMTDCFHSWSDDRIKGLIIHELSHLSCYWFDLKQEKPNLIKMNPKGREIRINQILGEYIDVPSHEYAEIEKQARAEAVRLGFEKEIEASDGKGLVFDEKKNCWRRIR